MIAPAIVHGADRERTVRAMDLRQIKNAADDFGLMTSDPALMNTASTKSAITFIDGDKESSNTAATRSSNSRREAIFWKSRYLILFGELPNEEQLGGVDLRHHASHLRSTRISRR